MIWVAFFSCNANTQKRCRSCNSVLAIDPEDLQAHYTLMLCYRGIGDEKQAQEHEKRYLRFKAQESAQAITGPYREKHPDDNNERQAIHEHVFRAIAGTANHENYCSSSHCPQSNSRRRPIINEQNFASLIRHNIPRHNILFCSLRPGAAHPVPGHHCRSWNPLQAQ